MCTEHPYHCLPQLLALSNGTKVGSGVSGRHANMYLENIGSSKVEATKNLLKSLKRTAPKYVSSLIESYTALIDCYINLAMLSTKDLTEDKDLKRGPRSPKCFSLSLVNFPVSYDHSDFPCPPCVLTKLPLLRPGKDYGYGSSDPIGGERVVGFDKREFLSSVSSLSQHWL